MEDFYITLPSSVKNPQFENTSSRYVTRLPQTLQLERDKYVVAVTDIIYPYSFVNVGRALNYWIHFKDGRRPVHVIFPSAQYSDIGHIIDTLNGEQRQRLKRSAPTDLDADIIMAKREKRDQATLDKFKNINKQKQDADEEDEKKKQKIVTAAKNVFKGAKAEEEEEAKRNQAFLDKFHNVTSQKEASDKKEATSGVVVQNPGAVNPGAVNPGVVLPGTIPGRPEDVQPNENHPNVSQSNPAQPNVQGNQSNVPQNQSNVQGNQPADPNGQSNLPGNRGNQPNVQRNQTSVQGNQSQGNQPNVQRNQTNVQGNQSNVPQNQPNAQGNTPNVQGNQVEGNQSQGNQPNTPNAQRNQTSVPGNTPNVQRNQTSVQENQSQGNQPVENRPNVPNQANGQPPNGNQPNGNQPVENRPNVPNQANGQPPNGNQPNGNQPVENRPNVQGNRGTKPKQTDPNQAQLDKFKNVVRGQQEDVAQQQASQPDPNQVQLDKFKNVLKGQQEDAAQQAGQPDPNQVQLDKFKNVLKGQQEDAAQQAGQPDPNQVQLDKFKNVVRGQGEEEAKTGQAVINSAKKVASEKEGYLKSIPQVTVDLFAQRNASQALENQNAITRHATLRKEQADYEQAATEYGGILAHVHDGSLDKNTYSLAKQALERVRQRIFPHDVKNARDYLYFLERDGRIHMDILDSDVLFVEFETSCAYFLGFHDNIVRESGLAPSKIDTFGNVSTLYLYCDIVDPIIVGDQKNQLLSVIPCRGQYGEMIHHTIPYPRYLPIMNSTVDSIKVELLSEFAEPINFNWGSTIIVLHFKKL